MRRFSTTEVHRLVPSASSEARRYLPLVFSRKKVLAQFSSLKAEAESARRVAREDVEKAKLYGITSLSKDILEVVDTLQKGIHAFEVHQTRHGRPSDAAAASTCSAPSGEERKTCATQLNSSESPDPVAMDQQQHEKSLNAIYQGVKLSMKALEKALSRHGIEKIVVKRGDAFDPTVHEALARVPVSAECPHETVAEVVKDGFKIKDRVLRATQVCVAVEQEGKEAAARMETAKPGGDEQK